VGNNGGSLYRFHLTTDRMHVDVSADPRLADRVADNLFSLTKFEGTESETLQIGKGFGTTPSIEWNLPRFVGDSSLEEAGLKLLVPLRDLVPIALSKMTGKPCGSRVSERALADSSVGGKSGEYSV
jgi:hypothetical protein